MKNKVSPPGSQLQSYVAGKPPNPASLQTLSPDAFNPTLQMPIFL
jgi:hypothetical protein